MIVVNFTIPEVMEKNIHNFMELMGFSSRAEFFRYSALRMMEDHKAPPWDDYDEEERKADEKLKKELADSPEFQRLSKQISEMMKKLSKVKLPSPEEQFANLNLK